MNIYDLIICTRHVWSFELGGVHLKIGMTGNNILRRKSLVSTDTVCNNFVRQS